MQILDVAFEFCPVLLPRQPINAGGCVPRQRYFILP